MRVHAEVRDAPSDPVQSEPNESTALLFVHGIGATSATWHPVMDLCERQFRVATFDLIGHGQSPVPVEREAYDRDRSLEDIDEVMASLGTANVVLVGHSLGGYLALAHAATRPNAAKGVVVLNTGPGFRDPEKREAWNDRSRRNADRFGVPVQVADLNLQHDSVVMDRLGQIETPTLVLAGSQDRPEYTGAGQYMERKMMNGKFALVEGGGHGMHEDTHSTDVADLIRAFVKSLQL